MKRTKTDLAADIAFVLFLFGTASAPIWLPAMVDIGMGMYR